MFFTVLLLSLFAFFKTLGYAIYEYKHEGNKMAGVVIMVLSVFALVAPCVASLL